MKLIFLKFGLILFSYTLIISNHIQESRYFLIRNTKSLDFSDYTRHIYIPEKKYIEKEKYYNYLSTYDSHLKMLVIGNTSEKILPFENQTNMFITLVFLLSVTIIILSIDITFKITLNDKILILAIPLLFYLFQGFNSERLNLKIDNIPAIESDVSFLKSQLNDLQGEQSNLEERVSDLEY